MTTRTWGLLPRPTRPALHYIVRQTSTLAAAVSHGFASLFQIIASPHKSSPSLLSACTGTTDLQNPASRDPARERGDQVFGERTRATAGSDDFANDDFFPDLGNLILDDNLNADSAAPAAPYVILSFLFEIVVEFMFLVCPRCDLFIYYASSHD